jgi:holo-[acyl-carrier protein] synthase
MVRGIGNDIIAISRIREDIEKHGQRFLDRLFTPAEQAYCSRYRDPTINYAGRFAAKEALVKALGTGFSQGIGWLDLEVLNDPHGKPYVNCSDKVKELFGDPQLLITISHCKEYASAFAIWLH